MSALATRVVAGCLEGLPLAGNAGSATRHGAGSLVLNSQGHRTSARVKKGTMLLATLVDYPIDVLTCVGISCIR